MTEHEQSAQRQATSGPPPATAGPRNHAPAPPAGWPAPSRAPQPPVPPSPQQSAPPSEPYQPTHPSSPQAAVVEAPPDADRRATDPDGQRPGRPAGPLPPGIWRESVEGLLALSVWTERVPHRGEDAEPFVAHHWAGGQGLLAVFDGSGGSGSASVWQAPDGTPRTGAWVGARVARLATDCWFREVATGGEPAVPESLREYLQYFLAFAPQRRSKIGGTMRRLLPTTLAAVHYRLRDTPVGQEVELQPLWAGDSRAYVLQPQLGLRVLTRDHTRESDALELLRTDPPMTNLVSADREFEIDSRRLACRLPCVLVAATDGFFGYVHTPADFELLLLRTLHEARHEEEWADLIRREVQAYTADDASLAVLALGYRHFEDLRARFTARLGEMTERYVRTRPRGLDRLSEAGTAAGPSAQEDSADLPARVRAWQESTWQEYRPGYESHLPPAPEEHG
ncbi:serine/threonine protein phosphatase [Streptomyces sp. NPDC052036]|uniref:serine/threonine protein phosphatase n=1 Tax=unclassified Streptomyces TaxID=2593676 RepID=UPI0034441FD5